MKTGFKDSLLTRFVEDHSHLIPFCFIVHQFELTTKESVGKGLGNDIKKYLLKLYYL